MRQIAFNDLKPIHQIIKNQFFNELEILYDNAEFSSTYYTEQLEKEFSKYINTQYAVAVNNGTTALHLALLTLNIKENDEVIVPANTYIGTIWGILYLKAKPVFIDCNEKTYNINTELIKQKITPKTKAIIGVHLYGQACEIKSILAICKEYKLYFIEDASQAHGALYNKQKVGSFGDINCFSLYPSKNLGAVGEGGIITTNNKTYYEKLKVLRNHGQTKKNEHNFIGYNYRMSSIQALSIYIKIKYLDEWNTNRIAISNNYLLSINNKIIKLPYINLENKHIFHLFVIQSKNRKQLINYLNAKGIQTQIHYPIACHLQKATSFLNYKKGDFPITENHANTCLSLPLYPFLSNENQNYIINVINKFS